MLEAITTLLEQHQEALASEFKNSFSTLQTPQTRLQTVSDQARTWTTWRAGFIFRAHNRGPEPAGR